MVSLKWKGVADPLANAAFGKRHGIASSVAPRHPTLPDKRQAHLDAVEQIARARKWFERQV